MMKGLVVVQELRPCFSTYEQSVSSFCNDFLNLIFVDLFGSGTAPYSANSDAKHPDKSLVSHRRGGCRS